MFSLHDYRCPTSLVRVLLVPILSALGLSHVGVTIADAASSKIASDRTADGAWAVAGAGDHDGYRGVAYVYRSDGKKWVLDATLAPAERGPFARFGGSVAVEGNTVVVGAPWDDGWHGAAYVYERVGRAWKLTSRVAPQGAVGDRFGTRVTLGGGVLSLSTDAGAVARFRRSPTGWTEFERTADGAGAMVQRQPVDEDLLRDVASHDASGGAPDGVDAATVIDPPSSVTATDGTYEDRTEVRWRQVASTGLVYQIYRRLATAPPSADVLIRVASEEDSLFEDATGTRGVVYTYCVRVADMTGTPGAPRCDDGSRILFRPDNFTASDATFEGFVRLNWADRSTVEAGYRILRQGNFLRSVAPNFEAFDDSTASPDTIYTYSLLAFDAAGSVTAALTDTGRSARISAPGFVSATDGQYTDSVVVTWTKTSELVVNYRVFRDGGLLETLPPDSLSYVDTNPVSGTNHEYCVAAVDALGNESARGCDSGGIGVLAAVADVQATDGSFDDKVRISWRITSETADGYYVYRKLAGTPTADTILVANLAAGSNSFEDQLGEHGVAYDYCVVAFSNRGGRSALVCDPGTRAVVLAPTAVQATDGTFEDRVDISWESSATTVVLFKVYRGTVLIRSVAGNRRSYSDLDVPSGVPANYSVAAVNAVGVESASAPDAGFRTLATPASVKASDDEHEDRVAVTWADRSLIENGYYIYRRELLNTVDPPVRIATMPSGSSSYLDRTGASGEHYTYKVTAFHAYGPGRADTTESDPGFDTGSRVLATPTFVEAGDGEFEDRIELSWVDNSRFEEAYHLWRRNTATNESMLIAVLPPNTSRYVNTPIDFGITYEYSVLAADSAGSTLLGTSVAGADLGSTAILPPSAVSASDSYADKVVVAWIDESARETGYEIRRDGVVIGTVSSNVTQFTDNGATAAGPLAAGVTYTYCVRAVSSAAPSDDVCDDGMIPRVGPGSVPNTTAARFRDRINPTYAAGEFGSSISGDVDRMIIGSPLYFPPNHPSSPNGGAYILRRTASGLQEEQILMPPNLPGGRFGSSVALEGEWAFISAPGVGSAFGNRLYFYKRNAANQWNVNTEITSMFGTSPFPFEPDRAPVDLDGTRAVVGKEYGSNSITFYRYSPSGDSWTQEGQPLVASAPIPSGTGRAVALSGSTAILGGGDAAFVFIHNGSVWAETQRLAFAAASVDIDGDRAVTGGGGFANVFEREGSGPWQQVATLTPERPDANFGNSISVRGDRILVGAPTGPGAVYVYSLQEGQWVRREILPTVPLGGISEGPLGYDVEILDGMLAASAVVFTQQLNGLVETQPTVSAPGVVAASDGTIRDKVQVQWSDDSDYEAGYAVYRDGDLVATVGPNERAYADFDAQPGSAHEYCVASVDAVGEGGRTCDFGIRPPDGNITGRVATRSGTGVNDTQVCLDPSPNQALLFDGVDGAMTVADGDVFGSAFTIEFWYRGRAAGGQKFVEYSTATTPNAFDLYAIGTGMTVSIGTWSFNLSGLTVLDGDWHHVAISWASLGQLRAYKDGLLVNAPVISIAPGYVFESGGTLVFGKSLSGAMDEIRVWDHVRTLAQIQSSMNRFLTGTEEGLSAYWPLDHYEGVGAEERVSNRYGRLSSGARWVGEASPLSACAVSDAEGNFVLPRLRYGTSTTFRVTPALAGRQFEPAFKTITLSTGSPVQNEVGFIDITSYTATGVVAFRGESGGPSTCLAAGVSILVDGLIRGTTDGSGRYSVPVPPGTHTIEARATGRVFNPPLITLANVSADVAGQNFLDVTVRKLTGIIGGGCGNGIGELTIKIDSEDGCFSRTITEESAITEELPPLKFFVRVIDVTSNGAGVDPVVVSRFFENAGAREVDLSAADTTLDFKYRAPIAVRIEGLAGGSCTVPVLSQGPTRYPLTITVYEDYGTGECPVDTGTVTVFDEIVDQEKTPVTLVVSKGRALLPTSTGLQRYATIANTPNIFEGRKDAQNNDRSYQKSLTVVAEVEGQESATATQWVFVTGHRPRAATFTSVSDGIPLLILRDPPGDNSFSFVQKESTFCTTVKNAGMEKFSTGYDGKVYAGVKMIAGFGVMIPSGANIFTVGGLEVGIQSTQAREFKICATTTEEFKTSENDAFIGVDGDVYVGIALNLIFAKTDVIDIVNCSVVKSEAVTLGVDNVETAYTFTEGHIKSTVIPQLDDLARLRPADSLRFNRAKQNWQSHLDFNRRLKSLARQDRNRSFSAGADYSFSSVVEKVDESSWSVNVYTNGEIGLGFGWEFGGTGSDTKWSNKLNFSFDRSGGSSATSTRTTGYTLSDDDVGDFFSVDVKQDSVYGTPVFSLLSGTSSCPWEPWRNPQGQSQTQPRDNAELKIETIRDYVEPDERAEFLLSMTSDIAGDEFREYYLLPVQTSNLGGASIFVGGDTFIQLPFVLNPRETKTVSLTVIRGPIDYNYEDLQLVLISTCQFDYWRNTGIAELSDTLTFSAHFKAPCSDITLFRPTPGWSVTSGQDSLKLTLADFDFGSDGPRDSLVSIGAEYRLEDTEEWNPIGGTGIPRSQLTEGLGGTSASLVWDVTLVPDGKYTIRAWSRCTDLNSGPRNYSAPATGIIDRTPPVVFGTPQPADGVLSFGEDISITFNEDISCVAGNLSGVQLDVIGGSLSPQSVAVDVTCNGRTLVLRPTNPSPAALEGAVLRARVENVRDIRGTPMVGSRTWDFAVARSSFAWTKSSILVDAAFGQDAVARSSLTNGTNADVPFTITNFLPSLTPSVVSDTVRAGETVEIAFTVANNLGLGTHVFTPRAVSGALNLPLQVRVDVNCGRPAPQIDPADFENSMTFVCEVKDQISNAVLDGREDILAAYVGNELRGFARADSVSPTQRLYFLTVYSKRQAGETIRFRFWDDDRCTLFGTNKRPLFVADGREGSVAIPYSLFTRIALPGTDQIIPVNEGWTWVSFNRRPADGLAVNYVLGDLNPAEGDVIKTLLGFSTFSLATGWQGDLDVLDNATGYMIHVSEAGNIVLDGSPAGLGTTSIPFAPSWNWIGYVPQTPKSTDAALANFKPLAREGDVIKSQSAFAQFDLSTQKWIGSLDTMEPGRGYKLYTTAAAGSFTYPSGPEPGLIAAADAASAVEPRNAIPVHEQALAEAGPGWAFNPRAYQFNMTITCEILQEGETSLPDSFVVAAMVGGEVRGLARVKYVASLGKYMAFVMAFSDQVRGETLTFMVYDPNRNTVWPASRTLAFAADQIEGSLKNPMVLSGGGGQPAAVTAFSMSRSFPNPVLAGVPTRISYALPTEMKVELDLFDIGGRLVRTVLSQVQPAGLHEVTVESADLGTGTYFYRMKAGPNVRIQKMVVLR